MKSLRRMGADVPGETGARTAKGRALRDKLVRWERRVPDWVTNVVVFLGIVFLIAVAAASCLALTTEISASEDTGPKMRPECLRGEWSVDPRGNVTVEASSGSGTAARDMVLDFVKCAVTGLNHSLLYGERYSDQQLYPDAKSVTVRLVDRASRDKFGNDGDNVLAQARYSRATLDKINFDKVRSEDFIGIADHHECDEDKLLC